MKVRCITNELSSLTKGKIYTVLRQTYESYHIADDNGDHYGYVKHRFEVVDETSLKDQLKIAKDEVARLEKLIDEEMTPHVGDKYKHDNDEVYIVSQQLHKNVYYYSLVRIQSKHNCLLGVTWTDLTADINNIFGLSKKRFTKIKQ